MRKQRSEADEIILSYNDVVLRRSDLDILRGPYFLNDRIIEFYFSYLSSCTSQDLLLVPPAIAFLIANSPEKSVLDPLNLANKKLVIFPVNDNDDVNRAEGGSHWSLLAYRPDANLFVHHDSVRGGNTNIAQKLRDVVAGFTSERHPSSPAQYSEPKSPQQDNQFDCGIFVIAIAQAICDWFSSSSDREEVTGTWCSEVNKVITPQLIKGFRGEILRLIMEKQKLCHHP